MSTKPEAVVPGTAPEVPKPPPGAGSGDGSGAGSGDGSVAGSGDGSGAGSGDGSGAGSGDGSGAGSGDGSGAGSGDGPESGPTPEKKTGTDKVVKPLSILEMIKNYLFIINITNEGEIVGSLIENDLKKDDKTPDAGPSTGAEPEPEDAPNEEEPEDGSEEEPEDGSGSGRGSGSEVKGGGPSTSNAQKKLIELSKDTTKFPRVFTFNTKPNSGYDFRMQEQSVLEIIAGKDIHNETKNNILTGMSCVGLNVTKQGDVLSFLLGFPIVPHDTQREIMLHDIIKIINPIHAIPINKQLHELQELPLSKLNELDELCKQLIKEGKNLDKFNTITDAINEILKLIKPDKETPEDDKKNKGGGRMSRSHRTKHYTRKNRM